jgi:hypothetical protein
MVLLDVNDEEVLLDCAGEPFPREVEFIISALEAGPRPVEDRHKTRRSSYRMRASLRLFSDMLDSPPRILFTRNVSPTAMGFLSDRPLPLSHGGTARIPTPDGKIVEAACTILRCRQAAPGWFEGAVYFNRPQPRFEADQMP